MRKLSLFACIALLVSGPVAAQEELLDYLATECEADLEQFCSTVNPGEGRILHCVAAHEDQLSGQCTYALYQAATLLDQMAAALSYVAQSCAEDIKAQCSDVQPGEGRLLSCLESKREAVSPACTKAMADTIAE
jgi:Golgi apparatus protein 1